MKLIIALTLLLGAYGDSSEYNEKHFSETIQVRCKNLDFDALSIEQRTHIGAAVAHSYNVIHEGDDTVIKDIVSKEDGEELSTSQNSWYRWWLYEGDVVCRYCLDDDAMLKKPISSSKRDLWAKELEKEIAGLQPGECQLKVTNKKSIPSAESTEEGNEEEVQKKHESGIKQVTETIEVRCKNIDFDTLSKNQRAEIGTAVKNSYNTVHQGEDTKINDIVSKEDGEELSTSQNSWYRWWLYEGDVVCRYCLDDDAMLKKPISSSKRDLWAKELEKEIAGLQPGECQLKVTNKKTIPTSNSVKVPAAITTRCMDINFQDIDTEESVFVSAALEEAFNEASPTDSNVHLTQLAYSGTSKNFLRVAMGGSLEGQFSGFAQVSDFDGTAVEFVAPSKVSQFYKLWEVHFLATLLKGPYEAFHSVKSCDISFSASTEKASS